MPNYPDQYFNSNSGATKSYSNQNKTIIKEEIVSGASTDNIYVAQLVKLVGASVNLQTGDINVDLDHSGDSVRLGDGTTLTNVAPGGYLLVSGQTAIANAGETVDITNGYLHTSGTTNVDLDHTSDSVKIGDGTNLISIGTSNQLKIGGSGSKPQFTFTRQADTNTYSIGDVINSGGTISEPVTVLSSSDKSSYIIGARLTHSVSASTEPEIEAVFFNSGFTISADQNLFEPNINELDHFLGYCTFNNWNSYGNRSVSNGVFETPILVNSQGSTDDLVYVVLVVRNAYAGANAEIFTLSLDCDQN